MSIFVTLVILCIIVIVHEFGHLIIAKSNGIDVKEFWVGFGPTLVSFTKGGTKYCLKPIPFGGACLFEEDVEQAKNPEKMFKNASLLARISTVFAGPLANFILAIIISILFLSLNPKFAGTTIINEVAPGSAAEDAGLMSGDKIIKYNNKSVGISQDFTILNTFNKGKQITLTYIRNNEKFTTVLAPKFDTENNAYLIGVTFKPNEDTSSLLILKNSFYLTRMWTRGTTLGLKGLLTKQLGVESIGGVVSIADSVNTMYETSKKYGVKTFVLSVLDIMIAISTSLGIMNLLPIPGVDGGRLLFFFIEAIRRKPMERKTEETITTVSMALLLVLMVLITGKDVWEIIRRQ